MPSYNCKRQVYHPLSARAEPTALLYYESSDDEDPVGEYGNLPWQAREQAAAIKVEKVEAEVEAKVGAKVEAKVEARVEADAGAKAATAMITTEVAETVQAAPQRPPTPPKAVESSQYELLRPENTFGESSPFKRSPNSTGRGYGRGREKDKVEGKGKEKEKVEEQELEGWEWEKQRYRVPGAFDSE